MWGLGTLGYDSPRKTYLNFRNNLSLIFKHFSGMELLYEDAAAICSLTGSAAFVFLVKGKPANGWAIIKAQWTFLHLAPAQSEKAAKASRRISGI